MDKIHYGVRTLHNKNFVVEKGVLFACQMNQIYSQSSDIEA